KDEVWVDPTLVAEVRFKERTDDGLLRQPVFLRFRDDKEPKDCVFLGEVVSGEREVGQTEPSKGPTHNSPLTPSPRSFNFSNLTKVFWKEEKYTKGDLIEYYRAVSPWMLPYLRDRCLVLTRYPDGIEGKSFFQKDAPDYAK